MQKSYPNEHRGIKIDDLVKVIAELHQHNGKQGVVSFIEPEDDETGCSTLFVVKFSDGSDFPFDRTEIELA